MAHLQKMTTRDDLFQRMREGEKYWWTVIDGDELSCKRWLDSQEDDPWWLILQDDNPWQLALYDDSSYKMRGRKKYWRTMTDEYSLFSKAL